MAQHGDCWKRREREDFWVFQWDEESAAGRFLIMHSATSAELHSAPFAFLLLTLFASARLFTLTLDDNDAP
jgi:hypothetical protein